MSNLDGITMMIGGTALISQHFCSAQQGKPEELPHFTTGSGGDASACQLPVLVVSPRAGSDTFSLGNVPMSSPSLTCIILARQINSRIVTIIYSVYSAFRVSAVRMILWLIWDLKSERVPQTHRKCVTLPLQASREVGLQRDSKAGKPSIESPVQ